MSAISLKSITGITSITTPAGVDNQLTLHNNNTTERVKIDVAGNVHVNNHLAVTGVTTVSDKLVLDNGTNAGRDVQWQPSNDRLAFFNDVKATFGNGADLSLYHNGSNSFIVNNNGYLSIQSQAGVNGIFIARNAEVNLYYGPSVRLQTSSSGVTINRDLDVDGHTNLDNVSIAGVSTFSDDVTFTTANGNNIYIDKSENSLKLGNSTYAKFGGAGELMMYHDGTYSVIKDINSSPFNFEATGTITFAKAGLTETYAKMIPDGAVELYHNGAEKLSTTVSGVKVTGITTSNNGFMFGTDGEMYLYKGAANTATLRVTSNGPYVEFKDNSGDVQMGSSSGTLRLSAGGNEKVRIAGGGNVGIASESPAARLDVFKAYNGLGAGNAAARIYGTDSGVAETGIRFVEKGTGDLHNQPDAYLMRGISNNVNKFVFLANGKVLIGGSTNHNSTIGSGVGGQLQVEGNTFQTSSLSLINNQSSGDPAFLVFGKSRAGSLGGTTIVQNGDGLGGIRWSGADGNDLHSRAAQIEVFVDGAPGSNDMPGRIVISTTPDNSPTPAEHFILYGSTKEVRNAGYYVAQTTGSGGSTTASFGATQSGMASNSYNYILSGSNDVGNKCVLFVNGSTRSADGGANTLTLRNDGGNLRVGNSGTNTTIMGNTYFNNDIRNQKTTFRYDNGGGIGAYLSILNRGSAAANTACGIVFGCDTSDAQLDGVATGDTGNGQIKVRNDGSDGGIMSFHVHTGANFEAMKIVGNLNNTRNATNGNSVAMKGGVAFSVAGVAIDKSWDNYPGLHVFNTTGHSDTNQGEFRFHGWNTSYNSYPQTSGSDFSVTVVADGMTITSDQRRKTGITTITDGLDTVSKLRGVSFTMINRDLEPQTHMSMANGKKLGFIAQEVIPILPAAIIDSGDHVKPEENGYCDRYKMDYGAITPVLVEAIKELKSKNEALEARIAALESS